MKDQATIAALIVTFNAEKFLRGCLESVKWADEIIVVDKFSADRTVNIAKEYTDKIIQDRTQSHEARSNIGIDMATSAWILKVNATEAITEELKEEIIAAVNSGVGYVGYHIPRKNYIYGLFIDEKPGPLYLFKRGAGRYACIGGHEKIGLDGKVGRLNNFKIHWSSPTIEAGVNKINAYTSYDAQKVFAGHPGAFYSKFPVRRANLFHMAYRPIMVFSSLYFVGRLYRYGMHGLVICVMSAFNHFIEIAKLWELQYKKENNIEDEKVLSEFWPYRE